MAFFASVAAAALVPHGVIRDLGLGDRHGNWVPH